MKLLTREEDELIRRIVEQRVEGLFQGRSSSFWRLRLWKDTGLAIHFFLTNSFNYSVVVEFYQILSESCPEAQRFRLYLDITAKEFREERRLFLQAITDKLFKQLLIDFLLEVKKIKAGESDINLFSEYQLTLNL